MTLHDSRAGAGGGGLPDDEPCRGEPGRAVGGCLTQWHAHDEFCSSDPANGLIDGMRRQDRSCPPGQVSWAAPPMLHTWVIDLPGGAFAGHVGTRAVFDQLQATPSPSPG